MATPHATDVPTSVEDPTNAAILRVAEDRLAGFSPDPIADLAQRTELPRDLVVDRLLAMLDAGAVRRIRQTLITTSLARGALVAWRVPKGALNDAFNTMFNDDPFTGHVVTRSTDRDSPGSDYRLWTTVKLPTAYALDKHCDHLATLTGATDYIPLPAKKLYALGVGHLRRRDIAPGDRTDEPARVLDTNVVELTDDQWRVIEALKREVTPGELDAARDPDRTLWHQRAEQAGISHDAFLDAGRTLDQLGVVGRFSAFLEHVKKHADGKPVTRYNALFHWRVPKGREHDAGLEVGRHACMTHAYWREGGAAFNHVNLMGVCHGLDKDLVLAHKQAIDDHLAELGIAVDYTNVFWGGRSEIKPSEFLPSAYAKWCVSQGLDPEAMKTP
ncbi:MAG: Lrp/AsnC family transcriptional regulator [Planctomycetota bacterium]